MDIENLKTFCAVANHKSFIKAAEFLNVTQSGISRRIQSLENELGVSLFVRTPQSVTITKIGKSFLPYAERTVQIYQEGQKIITTGHNDQELVIAAPPATSAALLPKILKQFRNEHRVYVSVNTAHSQHVFDMLIDKTIQVGFTSVAFPSSLLNYELLYMEEVVCVGHPDFVKEYILDDKIIKHPVPMILISLNNMSINPWESINQYFENNPLFEIILDVFYIQIILELVRTGVGLAVLPMALVSDRLKNGELVKVSLPEAHFPSRPVFMATYKNNHIDNQAIDLFKDTVRQVVARHDLNND